MGFSITEILNTPRKLSSSVLEEFFATRTNQFFSKKELMNEGFSSNIGSNLSELVEKETLWTLSTDDQTNAKNRKNVTYYALIDETKLDTKQIGELRIRCMKTPLVEAPIKEDKKPVKKTQKSKKS